MTDEWNGFANLLAELIEKHSAELSIDDIPTSKNSDSYNNVDNEYLDMESNIDKTDSV